ncbi:MAG: 4Fe-4S dicluster domain-containing protein [Candidatus Neomarinimicrobiota bacterium]|nr:MAG: 4Fe-4S dicluster domain-containing protein [bacterium]|tara:strand:+ start:1516 stop:1851 length:336 start_codon:yes stop_codon:yes gene_type:complete
MSKDYKYDHYKSVPDPASNVNFKKKKPKLIAVVDEDNCTGCQVCVPFCPVDCIEPVPSEKYGIPIPPVQVRHDECIGCQICAKACTALTWDAIRMIKTEEFEEIYDTEVSG